MYINANGEIFVFGDVNTNGGDFIGRDRINIIINIISLSNLSKNL